MEQGKLRIVRLPKNVSDQNTIGQRRILMRGQIVR